MWGWYLILVLISISLIISNFVYPFMCLLAICLLWKNVYSGPLSFWKNLVALYVCVCLCVCVCWAVWFFYIFWLLTPHWIYSLQISLAIQYVVFSLCVDGFLQCTKAFKFGVVPFVDFCFCFSRLRRQIQKHTVESVIREYADSVFF